MKKQVSISLLLSISVVVLVLVLYYMQIGVLESFEARTYDMRFKALRGPLTPNEKIAIITIDEKSIAELGRFPWTRKRFRDLIDTASRAGARAVIFDVLFPESESQKVDRDFAASVRRSGIITLAMAFEFSEQGIATGVTSNIPELQKAAKNISHINVSPDDDGVLRWTPLVIPYSGKYYPSIALTGAKEALNADSIDVNEYGINLGKRSIPTDGHKKMLINYVGPPGIYKRYSFSDVIKGRIKTEELKDKILLVGATAIALYDMRITPFSNNSPGVEVNANIIDNILRGNFIRRGGIEALMDMLFIAFMGTVVFLITLNLRAVIALPFVLALMTGYICLAYYLFLKGYWVSMIHPALSMFLSSSVAAYLRFFVVEKKTREIRSMFSSYVSSNVVEALINNPDMAKIGGERKEVTVLFSDIVGFTSLSEKLQPEEVVSLLNEYFKTMTDVIFRWEGTFDKIVGDEIMAFWGAPVDQPNHAELAVRCSLDMLNKLRKLQGKWAAEGKPSLSCGIGLNTGEVLVGNVGAEDKKMDYTIIGDHVNTGARVEALTREYNAKILLTEHTAKRIIPLIESKRFGHVELNFRESVKLKGREYPTGIYELVEKEEN